jgi:subtilase family serine protease
VVTLLGIAVAVALVAADASAQGAAAGSVLVSDTAKTTRAFNKPLSRFIAISATDTEKSALPASANASSVESAPQNPETADPRLAAMAAQTGRPVLIGRVAPSRPVQVEAVLALRNQSGLKAFIKREYDPADKLYGKYLTPTQFSQQFGPTESDVAAVANFLTSSGMTVTKASVIQGLVRATGPASVAEKAFGVRLSSFVAPSGRVFMAQDVAVKLPSDIAPRVTTVLGLYTGGELSKFSRPVSPSASSLLHYSGNAGLSPTDISNLYNLGAIGSTLKGSGQVIGLFEDGTFTNSDLDAYEKNYNLNGPIIAMIGVDGYKTSSTPGKDADEVTLDLDMVLALASDVNEIQVYENTDQAVTDVFQQFIDSFKDMATINTITNPVQPLPTVISVSYGESEFFQLAKNNPQGPADSAAENSALSQLASQGQTVCAASGDAAAWTDQSIYPNESPNCSDPASEPYVTGVGGTDVTQNSAAPYGYKSETSWFDSADTSRGKYGTGGGGGVSVVWPIPTWQVGAFSSTVNTQGSSTFRNVPDVSLYGDFDTGGYDVFLTTPGKTVGTWQSYNGTSAACPLWAACIADMNQERVLMGNANLGFFNATIYPQAESYTYANDFHDIADSSTNGVYKAVTGYDNSTGWGSLIGASLCTDLTGLLSATTTTVTCSPASPVLGQTVVFKAVVAGNSPSGSVDFTIDGSDLGPVPMTGTSATYSWPDFAVGPHTVSAVYSGDNYNATSTGNLSMSVNANSTTTTIVSSKNPATHNVDAITYTVTVKPVSAASGTPTGYVEFTDGLGDLYTNVTLNSAGVATYTMPAGYLGPGSFTIEAIYQPGGSNFVTSNATLTEVVNPNLPTLSLFTTMLNSTQPSGPLSYAERFTIHMNVATTYLYGVYDLFIDDQLEQTYQTPPTANSYNWTFFSAGAHTIRISYYGDSYYDSNSMTLNETVSKAITSTSVTSTLNPAVVREPVTLNASVFSSPGFEITGTVQFYDGTATLGAPQTLSGGDASTATLKTSALAVGSHKITAKYVGDTNNVASVSPVYVQTIGASPVITSVSPAGGPLAGGTAVTVSGTGFFAGETVNFGKVPATNVVVVSATKITCASPKGAAGTVDVSVESPGGTISPTTPLDRFIYCPVPTLTLLSHTSGPVVGEQVTVTGTGFILGDTTVKFGKTVCSPNSVSVSSPTSLSCGAPPEAVGTVDVTVTTPGGTTAISAADKFTYDAIPVVSSISPSAGPLSGGTVVTLTGTGFLAGCSVKFAPNLATLVTVVSPTKITCKSPASTVAATYVSVTTPGGTSATSANTVFRYVATPKVTAISPSAGPLAGATAVTISGTGFVAGATVQFGTVAATGVTLESATSITCKAPAEAAGTVDVRVTTPGGTSAVVAADKYMFDPAVVVSSVTPNTSPTAGGTAVTIKGKGFVAGATVKFGTVAATDVVVSSATTITCKSPAHSAGTVDVTVTTPGGTSAVSSADKVTY